MKTTVLCQDVVKEPESKAKDARIGLKATFKRIGRTKRADEDTDRVISESPSVSLAITTWVPTFVAGQEYIVEITPKPVKPTE